MQIPPPGQLLPRLLTPSDLILLGIFLFAFYAGFQRGILRSVYGFAQGILSLFVSSMLARLIAPVVSEYLVQPILGDVFMKKTQTAFAGAGGDLAPFASLFPQQLVQSSSNPIQMAVGLTARTLSQNLGYVISFFLLLWASHAILRVVFHALRRMTKIAPIGMLNRLAGGALSLAMAFCLVLITLVVLSVFSPALFSPLGALSPATREKTYLTQTLYQMIQPYLPAA